MTTAFVLSGGGSLGAVQVGMLIALQDRGFRPDLLVGTSVGALNAAFIASHGFGAETVDELATVWRGIRRRDVYPLDPVQHALGFAGLRPSLCRSDSLARLLDRHLGLQDLRDAQIPLRVVATDVLSGREVVLSTGDATSAVLASAAIPAVFPSVPREGRTLMDGGVADNAAVSEAVRCGADQIVVLPSGFACALETPPRTPLTSAVHALTVLIEQRLIVEVAHFADVAEIVVLPPLCPLAVSSVDFRQSRQLINRAHRATIGWLDAGGHRRDHPERFLSLHSHAASAGRGG